MGQRYAWHPADISDLVLWYGPRELAASTTFNSDSRVYVGNAEYLSLHYVIETGVRIHTWHLQSSQDETGGTLTTDFTFAGTGFDLNDLVTRVVRVQSLTGPWVALQVSVGAGAAAITTSVHMLIWGQRSDDTLPITTPIAEIGVS